VTFLRMLPALAALGARLLHDEAGFFRLGETAVFHEGENGGGAGGGSGDAGAGGSGDAGANGEAGAGGDGGASLLADAQAAIKTLTDAGTQIPEALTKAVNELKQARQDAGRYRTEKNETTAKVTALEDQLGKIAKHLGLKEATPEEIAEALKTERDALANENRTLKVGQTLTKVAKTKGADEDALTDSRTFMAEVDKLDPSKDDFTKALEELVDKALKDNPKLKAQAARSGYDPSGGGGGSNGSGGRPSLAESVAARVGG
jgi:hypothetical protein